MKKKLKVSKCLWCRKEFYEKDLHDCPFDDCPMGQLCDKCLEEHIKHHDNELIKGDYDKECIELLNSLNGEYSVQKGNYTSGLW